MITQWGPAGRIDDEETAEVQLDLFGLDRIKLGEGYAALSKLDLDKAASIFADLVREHPDFIEAAEGKAMAAEWGDVLWEIEALTQEAAAQSLWEKISSYAFGQWGNGLRKALVKRVINLIGDDNDFYVPPGVCLGFFYFELADYERAEKAYRRLLKNHPNDAGLICGLGNSLFLQKRRSEARHFYAQALLATPAEVDAGALEDGELRDIVKEWGTVTAPVFGWLRDVLPLIEEGGIHATGPEHEKALMIYRTISRAEAARRQRDHRRMVEQRRNLKEIAPEVFEEYITRLA